MSYQVSPWIRNIQVEIGPLMGDKLDPTNTTKGLRIFSDGSQNGLRVRFQVHKHVQSTARPTSIEIYNLSETSRQSIRIGTTQIRLSVGYNNMPMKLLFSGALLSCSHHREGADIITTIQALAGYGGLVKPVKVEHTVDTAGNPVDFVVYTFGLDKRTGKPIPCKLGDTERSLKNLLKELGAAYLGVNEISMSHIKIDDVNMPKSGKVYSGLMASLLNQLSREYNFVWRVDNGQFEVYTPNFNEEIIVISSDNGTLIRAEPILYGDLQKQIGVSITAVLNPLAIAAPGQRVQLISKINPTLNVADANPDPNKHLGYIVTSLTHAGDSHSSQWQTQMECDYSWKKPQ